MDFGNIVTAMVTPFDGKENIDFNKVTKLINYLIENGSDSILISGTTGESPTLTIEEKLALFRHAVKVVDGRVPIIAGTGSNNTRASIELTKKAEETGVDAILLVTPYYNKPTQEGIYEHFKAIAETTTLPIMLYNVPGRTITNIAAETTIKLASIPNIVAVKESSGDLDQMSLIIENTPDDFLLYSGDDSLTLPTYAIGGNGVVSVASHVVGNEMQEMIKNFQTGNLQKAAKIHRNLVPLIEVLFSAPSPTPVKVALQMFGVHVGGVRLPLVPLTEEERQNVSNALQSFLQKH